MSLGLLKAASIFRRGTLSFVYDVNWSKDGGCGGRSPPQASGRLGMRKKVCSIGGTNHPFDPAFVEMLNAYPKRIVELRSDSACDAWGYRQWQVEGVNIVSIPGFCARTPVIQGSHLWFYSPRFDTAGLRHTPDSVAAARLKSKTRKFLGVFAGTASSKNATADSGINSFGRHFVPSYVRVMRQDAWSVVPVSYRFSPRDAASVRKAKILGPEFLYDALAYPEYLDNPRWPFWRRTRPSIAQRDAAGEHGRNRQFVLASRPDTALSGTGLGRRAWDPLPPPKLPARQHPLAFSKAAAESIERNRSEYARVCAGRGAALKVLRKAFEGAPYEERFGEVWIIGAPLDRATRATLVDALRRLDDAVGEERQHIMHVVARCCMATETLAWAASPPPPNHREWRDARRREAARKALRAIDEAITAGIASPCSESMPQALLNAEAVRLSATAVSDRIDRWMTVAEAVAIVHAVAKAACAGIALASSATNSEKQEWVDLIAAVVETDVKRPLAVTHKCPTVTAFLAVRDAVASALYDEPLDEHEHGEFISHSPLVATIAPLREKKRGGVRMATREIRQELQRIIATEEASSRILVEPAADLLVAASDYVSRAWLQQPTTTAVHASRSPATADVPIYVTSFPFVTPVDVGVREEHGIRVSVSSKARGDADPQVAVYEARQSASVDLPAGMRVLVACFGAKGSPHVAGKELKLRVQNKDSRVLALHTDRPIRGGEEIDAVGLSIKDGFVRVHLYDDGRVDALVLFLPVRAAI